MQSGAIRGSLLMAAVLALFESGHIVFGKSLPLSALPLLLLVAFSVYGALALALSLALRKASPSRAASALFLVAALMGSIEMLDRKRLAHPDAGIARLLPEGLLRLAGVLLLSWLLDAALRRGRPLRHRAFAAPVAAWLACCLLAALVAARLYVKDRSGSFPVVRDQTADVLAAGVGADHRKSAVLLLIDTLRASALGCYGQPGEISPHLDALSRRGRLFAENRSQASWTKASTASIFTSLHPEEHGAAREKAVLPRGVATLAEQLAGQSVLTLGFSANGSVSPLFQMNQGFREFTYLDTMDETAQAVYRLTPLKFASSVLSLPIHFAPIYGATADLVVGTVASRLARLDANVPVFLYVHFMDPHSPYLSPPGSVMARKVQNFSGTRSLALRAYLDEVHFTDRQVGRLLRSLKVQPAFHGAVVAVTADHGEEFYEHGGISHGYTLFDELLRVPLIISSSILPAGIERRPTQGIDLAPTLLAACGASAPPAFEGRDLSSPFPDEELLFQEEFGGIRLESLKSDRLKLVTGRGKHGDETLLFDLDADPGESRPLSSQRDEHRLLDEIRSMSRRRAASAAATDDRERERRLRALGYLK